MLPSRSYPPTAPLRIYVGVLRILFSVPESCLSHKTRWADGLPSQVGHEVSMRSRIRANAMRSFARTRGLLGLLLGQGLWDRRIWKDHMSKESCGVYETLKTKTLWKNIESKKNVKKATIPKNNTRSGGGIPILKRCGNNNSNKCWDVNSFSDLKKPSK